MPMSYCCDDSERIIDKLYDVKMIVNSIRSDER